MESASAVKRVLLIECDCDDSRALGEMIQQQREHGFELGRVEDVVEAETYLATHDVDVVLADLRCDQPSGESRGQEVVERFRGVSQKVSTVLLLSPEMESTAKMAMQQGVQDYLIHGEFEPRELVRALENAIERRSTEEARLEEKERAQVTLDSIGDAVISTDSAGKITFLNQGAERLTGWSMAEAQGKPMADVFTVVHATTRESIADPMALAMQESRVGHLPGTCILIRRDGEEMYIEDSAAPIQGVDGKVTGAVIVFRDVSEARKLAEEMMHASQHDFLTGLPNRLLLEDRLAQAIALAERHSGEVAVLYVDLDRFKKVNDSLGHLVGDKLLQSIAERLQAQVRTPDTVSRQGGDEFVVVLQDVKSRNDVEVVAKRILEAISAVHGIGEHRVHVTASLGVGVYPEDGLNAETVMTRADAALYEAKAGGRGCFRFFGDETKGVVKRGEAMGREG